MIVGATKRPGLTPQEALNVGNATYYASNSYLYTELVGLVEL